MQAHALPPARMTVVPCPRGRGHPAAQHATGLRERGWWVMRQTGRFTLESVVMTVATGQERGARHNLQQFIGALERVGVLVRLARREPGASLTSNGHVAWHLARDLGRIAPVWRARQRLLFDPNSGALLPPLPGAIAMPKSKGRTTTKPNTEARP